MKPKNAFVIMIFMALLLSCSPPKITEVELEGIRKEVMDADLAFSSYSSEHGFAKALAEYASIDAIKLNPKQYPVFGRVQLENEAAGDTIGTSRGTLTWKPLKVHVATSGDLAAAFGDWYFRFKSPRTSNDTTLYGNYITVWKKQQDGNWKFVMDGGNPTPGPTSDEMLAIIK